MQMSGSAPHCGPNERCITCGDEAEPMRILGIDAVQGLAVCEDGRGARRSVEIELVEPVSAGDRLLVQADVALTNLGAAAWGSSTSSGMRTWAAPSRARSWPRSSPAATTR